jgi:3-oxoacyl-[acyl-carrier protein] reductase
VNLGLNECAAVASGGSKGMGRAVAETPAGEGARVAVLARTGGDLDATVDALPALGAQDAIGIQTGVTSHKSVGEASGLLGTRWGSLNVLVNAVGPVDVGVGRFEDIEDPEWISAFDVGTMGAVGCVHEALPLLRSATWARIVSISAHSTKRLSPGLVAYTAAKSATTSLTKNLPTSLAGDAILVNTVSPGSSLSDGMKADLRAIPPERHAVPYSLFDAMYVVREDFGHPAHLERAADPVETGSIVAFLCSQANTYITGADLSVDGGSDFT